MRSRRKLIELSQEYLVTCDNIKCDYKVKNQLENIDLEELKKYINVKCPKCGDILLTNEDYLNFTSLMRIINFMNKWFSWLTIFFRNKKNYRTATVKTHKKIKIEIDESSKIY